MIRLNNFHTNIPYSVSDIGSSDPSAVLSSSGTFSAPVGKKTIIVIP